MRGFLNYLLLPCLFLQHAYSLVDIVVDQTLLNSGFHRLLTTNITLYGNLTSCRLLVEETFPKNLFVDINDIENNDDNVLVRTDQNIDMESTASLSYPFSTFVFLNRNEPVQTSAEFGSKYIYTLPVHVRYHDPKVGGGYREFKKQPFALFARCPEELSLPTSVSVKLPCDRSSSKLCKWTSLPFTQKNVLPPILVPVGDVDHHLVAFLSTHIAAYTGVIVVIYNLLSV